MQYISYRENKIRGTADFPLEFHHVTSSHPQYTMPYHWHLEFEIIRILQGEFSFSLEEQEHTAVQDSFILIPAGLLHAGIPRDCIYECIVFNINMLVNDTDSCRKLIKQISDHQFDFQTYFDASYKDMHQNIWTLFDTLACRKPAYQMIAQGCLYQLFGTLISEHYYNENPSQTPKDHNRIIQIKHVLEFIENHYATSITLNQLSKCVGMSPKYFCRFFQEMTHRTPIDYLNYYRIERACYQLVTTDFPITEVAFNSGFNDLSYFIKTFKKYKGTTPKKYLHS